MFLNRISENPVFMEGAGAESGGEELLGIGSGPHRGGPDLRIQAASLPDCPRSGDFVVPAWNN
jgi:hypothetical protein